MVSLSPDLQNFCAGAEAEIEMPTESQVSTSEVHDDEEQEASSSA